MDGGPETAPTEEDASTLISPPSRPRDLPVGAPDLSATDGTSELED